MTLSCNKKLSALLRGITAKHHGDFFCLNCLHIFGTENKRESRKKVCKNKNFYVLMPSKDTKILEINQYQKTDIARFIIYADLECLIENIDGCKNSLENSSTTEVSEYIPSHSSVSIISLYKGIENKHDVYRGKNCVKKFCKSLREHTVEIMNFKKKNFKNLEQQKSYEKSKICYICKEQFERKYVEDRKFGKVRDHCHYKVNMEVLCIAYVT